MTNFKDTVRKTNNNSRLPFTPKPKMGIGEWIYVHRVGLLATVVVYLSIFIMFLSYKILIKPVPVPQMEIEILPDAKESVIEQTLEEKIEQLQSVEQVKVSNKASDENAKLDKTLRDDRRSNTEEVYDEAERVQEELKSGKEAYEKGLAELANMQKKNNKKPTELSQNSKGKDKKRQTAKTAGNVTVSYDLENRTDVSLFVPAYQCEGGGEVVVNITVNRNGKVIAASIAAASNQSDQCILNAAIQAAKASAFNTSANAPDKQKGTITYLFVAQ